MDAVMITLLIGVPLLLYRFHLGIDRTGHVPLEIGKCRTIGSREVQEDDFNVMLTEDACMAVIADGMGKSYGGKIAAAIAVEVFTRRFAALSDFSRPQYYFNQCFHLANQEILKTIDNERGSAAVLSALIIGDKLYYALAGNCRIAVYRQKELIPLSEGHTVGVLAGQKYREGKISRQDALRLLEAQRVYNFVGQDGFQNIEFFDIPVTLHRGDIIVLMTDGIFDGVPWVQLEEILAKGGAAQAMCLDVVQRINQNLDDDKDNGAVIMLRYHGPVQRGGQR